MKFNIKLIIYILIICSLASVAWIKYDYDRGHALLHGEITVDEFNNFLDNNNIKKTSFTCPANNESIIYLDDKYLLTDSGEVYQVKYDSIFNNGYNCKIITTSVSIKGFYNNNALVYDNEYNIYTLKDNNISPYVEENLKYYLEDIMNLDKLNNDYQYIYFYDVSSQSLLLDESLYSNKLLIDFQGNINVYTNYGYPTSFNLLTNNNTEIIFNKQDYLGDVFVVFRSNNNNLLDIDHTKYLQISEEVPNEVHGIRLITNKGIYNEVMDNTCDDVICDTKLVFDEEFSKYFGDITYSNGKYLFTKNTPTTIYNIEKYVSNG